MKLFIKERGAAGKTLNQWEAAPNVTRQKNMPHLLCETFCYGTFFLYPQT